MKLIWYPIDNNGEKAGKPYVIADHYPMRGPGSMVVLEVQMSHDNAVEVVQYPRAESADHFARGNATTTVRALVDYEFTDFRECNQFCAQLGAKLAPRGNLVMQYRLGGSDMLPRAVWAQIPIPAKLGRAVTLGFTFIGGRINT